MGHDYAGAAPSLYVVHYLLLYDRVYSTGSLVQDENGRIRDKSPCNLHSLSLSTREVRTTVCEDEVVGTRLGGDNIVDAGILARLYDIALHYRAVPHRKVLCDCSGEEIYLLADRCDTCTLHFAWNPVRWNSIEKKLSAPRSIESTYNL